MRSNRRLVAIKCGAEFWIAFGIEEILEPDFLTCLVPPLIFLSSWKARQYDGFSMIFARGRQSVSMVSRRGNHQRHSARFSWRYHVFSEQENAPAQMSGVSNPEHALTPLARLLPDEQLGYAGVGGDSSCAQRWTTRFEDVTVRQFINRVSEHIGPRGSWILSGSKDQRFFFFFKFGFH